jgi:hypothetical protein
LSSAFEWLQSPYPVYNLIWQPHRSRHSLQVCWFGERSVSGCGAPRSFFSRATSCDLAAIASQLGPLQPASGSTLLTRARHRAHLDRAVQCLEGIAFPLFPLIQQSVSYYSFPAFPLAFVQGPGTRLVVLIVRSLTPSPLELAAEELRMAVKEIAAISGARFDDCLPFLNGARRSCDG